VKKPQKYLFYPLRQIWRRPKTFRNSAAVAFCLLFLIALSLILSESMYLGTLDSTRTGHHYAAVYGLNGTQVQTITNMKLKADITIVPVIGEILEYDGKTTAAYVTVYTEALAEYYDLYFTAGAAPNDGEIAVSKAFYQKSDLLEYGEKNNFLLNGSSTVLRSIDLSGIFACNNDEIPYVIVNQATADAIQYASDSKIVYDLYFTTPAASSYACALIIEDIVAATDFQSDTQILHNSNSRRQRYGDFINFTYLDRVSYDYMSDASFFYLILPILIASALITASFLVRDTEEHIGEYGLLKASGAGIPVLLGTLYVSVILLLIAAVIPVLLASAGIAKLYIYGANAQMLSYQIPYHFGLPFRNLLTVGVYYLLLTCLFVYLGIAVPFNRFPYQLLRRSLGKQLPYVQQSSLRIMAVRDKVGHMAMLRTLRQWKKGIASALTSSLLMGVCGYMLMSNAEVLQNQNLQQTLGDCILYTDIAPNALLSHEAADTLRESPYVSAVGTGKWLVTDENIGSLYLQIPPEKADFTYASKQFYSGDTLLKEGYGVDPTYRNQYMKRTNTFACDTVMAEMLVPLVKEWDGDFLTAVNTPGMIVLIDEDWSDDASHYRVGDQVLLGRDGFLQSDNPDTYMTFVTIGAIIRPPVLPECMRLYHTLEENGSMILSQDTAAILDQIDGNAYCCVQFTEGTDGEEACLALAAEPRLIRYSLQSLQYADDMGTALERMGIILRGVFIGILFISLFVLSFLTVVQQIRADRREYALIRQTGGSDKTIRHQIFCTQTHQFITDIICTILLFFIVLWFITVNFDPEEEILSQFVLSAGYACVMHGVHFVSGQLAVQLYIRRLLKHNIMDVLRGNE